MPAMRIDAKRHVRRGRGRNRRRASALAGVALAGLATFSCATTLPPREPARSEPAVAPVPDEPPAAATAPAEIEPALRHFVTPGQTLWRIARAYGIPLDVLIEANEIADPTDLAVGTELRIPGATVPVEVPAFPAPVGPAAPPVALVDEWRWPVVGALSSGFGVPRARHRHAGVDIRAAEGEPVRASRAGVVVFAGSRRGYGHTIILDHGDGHHTLYAHAERLFVEEGAEVRAGQEIATVGRTGNATGTHCHFEVLRHGTPVDPLTLLPRTHESVR